MHEHESILACSDKHQHVNMVWQPTTVIVSVAIILHHITVEKLQLIITTHHHNKILHTNPKSEEKKENFSPRHVKTTKNRTTNPCTQPKVAYKRTTVIRASIDVSRYKKNTQHQSRPNSCSLSTTSHSIVPAHSKATTDNNHTIKCWRKATRKIDTQRK